MKNKLIHIGYFSIIVLLLVATGLGVYIYTNSFKLKSLDNYELENDSTIMGNYDEFFVENSLITKTELENANIIYSDASIVQYQVKNIDVALLDYVTKSSILGKNNEDDKIYSNTIGIVVDIYFNNDSSTYYISIFDYYSIEFKINLGKNYLRTVKVGDKHKLYVNLLEFEAFISSATINLVESQLEVRLKFVENIDLSNLIILADSNAVVLVSQSDQKCFNVSIEITKQLSLLPNGKYKAFIKKRDGTFEYVSFSPIFDGDTRLGIKFDYEYPSEIISICILET
ncbi:MAG: hypothetical protein LBF12_06995 [Christensenellaceae bacterium]|nr:hypothetical protein [Christensenellaceae bacterium]